MLIYVQFFPFLFYAAQDHSSHSTVILLFAYKIIMGLSFSHIPSSSEFNEDGIILTKIKIALCIS